MTTRPHLASTREELRSRLRGAGTPVVLVPTMGALHAGHASLMAHARERAGETGVLVASIFVNPTQFAPGEDLDRYPRTLETDLDMCAAQGVDIVFAPPVEEVYPEGVGSPAAVTVSPGPLGAELEGGARPTHFAGVLTVVAKLFGLVRPDVAVFGQKDYQQLVLIRRMATDLCMGVEVVGAETVREAEGLALSSRNQYLSPEDRQVATILSRALFAAREAVADPLAAARAELEKEPDVQVDYLVLTDPDLGPAPTTGPARLLVAARVGTTRLLDNVAITLGEGAN